MHPKADIGWTHWDVRFVPKADISTPSAPRTPASSHRQPLAVNKNADGQRRKDEHDYKAADYQS